MFYDENDTYNMFLVQQPETMAYQCQCVIMSICNMKVFMKLRVFEKIWIA